MSEPDAPTRLPGDQPSSPRATRALGQPVEDVVAWFDEIEADAPTGPTRPAVPDRRSRSRRRAPRSWFAANAPTVALAIVAAAATLPVDAHPTIYPGLDAVLRAAFGATVTILAAQARRWTWLVLAGLAAAGCGSGADLPTILMAWLALAGAVSSVAFDVRRRWIGAAVGGLAINAILRLPAFGAHGLSTLIVAGAVTAIALSAYQRQRSRTRALLRRAVLVAAGVVVVTGGGLGVATLIGAAKVNDGIDELRAGVASAKAGDDQATTTHLQAAVAQLEQGDVALNSWYAAPARFVPLVSHQAGALGQMATTSRDLARTASDTVARADYRSIDVGNGRIDTARIAALGPPLREVGTALERAQADMARLDPEWLVPPLRDKFDELQSELDETATETATAAAAVEVAPALLGADGPRRYFVAFTTPAESRGMGGLMGNWAELTADHGRLELTRTGRGEDLQWREGDPRRVLDAPADYLERYSRLRPEVHVVDVPFSPDFPSDARALASVYPQTNGGRPVDGVIAIDPYGLAAMLRITGPVTVEGLDTPLTADNAADVLLRQQYVDFDKFRERVDFLEEASRTTFDAFLHTTSLRPTQLADALGPMVAQRRVMMASTRADEQDVLVRLGLDGGFPAPDQGDFFSVVSQNGGNNKIDVFLRRDIDYQATFDPATGSLDATATITLHNDAPADGLPDYVIANRPSSGQPPGTNWMWLNFYSPHLLVDATIDGRPLATGAQRELGRHVYEAYVAVPSRGQVTVVLHLKGNLAPGDEYRVSWFQQPLVNPDHVQVTVQPTSSWSITGPLGAPTDGPAVVTRESREDGTVVVPLTPPADPP